MKVRISFSKGLLPLLFSSLIVLCLAGCAEDSSILDNGRNRQLEFSVTTCGWNSSNSSSSDSRPYSRATPISTFDTSNSFNVIADVNKGSNWTTEIKNETVSYSTANNIWQTTATHYWSGTGSTVNFYVYYPTSISGSITHSAGSAPVLSYTVPDNAAAQIDILTSSKTSVAGDSYTQIPVDFKHILAAVQFRVGSFGLPRGTISSITISGIKNSGVYTFDSGWTLNSGTTTFNSSPSTVINGTSGESITAGTYTLLMIPQAFSNATITLTYNTGTTYTKTISDIWTAGNTYTYNLSKSVNIGDYYYSDGTWGTISENPKKIPIAIIFSNKTSTKDKAYGFTHGYAMALSNANAPTCWSLSEGSSDNMMVDSSGLQTDYDGYDHFMHIFRNKGALMYSSTNYPAFYAARNYGISAPSGSSGWYLPSVGQWYLFISNIGKDSVVTYSKNSQTGSYIIEWKNSTSVSSTIESVMINTKSDSFIGYWYWCSSEQNSNYGSLTNISSNDVYTGGMDPHKERTPDESERLRSVIAF
ncbi:MAG TPA: fimbrillin family protein [Prevotella sp.]|nr:fimbrillin family protein [Prevotella sp.]